MDFEYCSQNRGWQQPIEKGVPYIIYSCIWFKIYRIWHGFYDEELIVWNWRRETACRDKTYKIKEFFTKIKFKIRRIRGSKRTDN